MVRGRRRLAGAQGGAESTPAGMQPRSAADGFTLIGLLVAVTLINVGLAVAVTSWATLDKRAKEAELIWRGQQYVRALNCHQAETGGPPDDLDELLESDCIRALYPDPMSPDGGWRLLRQSDLELGTGGATGFAGNRSAAILDGIDRELRGPEAFFGGRGTGGGRGGAAAAGGAGSLQEAYLRLQDLSQRINDDFGSSSGDGIVGVASRSTDRALRLYNGEATYDAWHFAMQ